MPDEVRVLDRYEDPYAWLQHQLAVVTREREALLRVGLDADELREFLEESADRIVSAVKSHLINLMAHAVKVALTSNPDVTGHWRTECFNFHLELSEEYRKSMRRRIDIEKAWRKASQKVRLSFADHGEPAPDLPDECPFTLNELI